MESFEPDITPHTTSMRELAQELYDIAGKAADTRYKFETTQWPDGRTVENLVYDASSIVNVRLTRPSIDTQELMDVEDELEDDSEHNATSHLEVSILCQRRFRIELANGDHYSSDYFYLGCFPDGLYLLQPNIMLGNEGQPYISGWNQLALTPRSDWFLQELITPKAASPITE